MNHLHSEIAGYISTAENGYEKPITDQALFMDSPSGSVLLLTQENGRCFLFSLAIENTERFIMIPL